MKRLLIAATLLVAAGCSNSPTSPTPVTTVTPPVVVVTPTTDRTTLHWEIMAPGCAPLLAPSPLPDSNLADRINLADGSLSVSWNYRTRGLNSLLYARFVEGSGTMNLCTWDTAN